jgi:hypothetical protein
MKSFEYDVFFSTDIGESGELLNPTFGKLKYDGQSSII